MIRQRERELRESHLSRLRRGLAESLETSEIHLDVLTNLKAHLLARHRAGLPHPRGGLRPAMARERLRILIMAAEAAPFAKTGGLADGGGRCRARSPRWGTTCACSSPSTAG